MLGKVEYKGETYDLNNAVEFSFFLHKLQDDDKMFVRVILDWGIRNIERISDNYKELANNLDNLSTSLQCSIVCNPTKKILNSLSGGVGRFVLWCHAKAYGIEVHSNESGAVKDFRKLLVELNPEGPQCAYQNLEGWDYTNKEGD